MHASRRATLLPVLFALCASLAFSGCGGGGGGGIFQIDTTPIPGADTRMLRILGKVEVQAAPAPAIGRDRMPSPDPLAAPARMVAFDAVELNDAEGNPIAGCSGTIDPADPRSFTCSAPLGAERKIAVITLRRQGKTILKHLFGRLPRFEEVNKPIVTVSTVAITPVSVAQTLLILEKKADLPALLEAVPLPLDDLDEAPLTAALRDRIETVIAVASRDELAKAVAVVAAAVDAGSPAMAQVSLDSVRALVESFVTVAKAEQLEARIVVSGTTFDRNTELDSTLMDETVDEAKNEVFFDKTPPEAPKILGISSGLFNTPQPFTLLGEEKASFEYSLDGGQNWIPYQGEVALTQDGAYTVTARQTDRAGNVSPAADPIELAVDAAAPAAPVASGLQAGFYNYARHYKVAGVEPDAVLECSLDGGQNWQTLPENFALSLESEGAFLVSLRQRDKAGNLSPATEPVAVTIDLAAPAAPVIAGIEAGLFKSAQAFTVTGEQGATLEYSLDGGQNWIAYQAEVSLSQDGAYTVTARQTDRAGNASPAADPIELAINTSVPPSQPGILAGANWDFEAGSMADWTDSRGTTTVTRIVGPKGTETWVAHQQGSVGTKSSPVTVSGGTIYQLRFSLKAPVNRSAQIQIIQYQNDTEVNSQWIYPSGTGDWSDYRQPFHTAPGVDKVRVSLEIWYGDTVSFHYDDLHLTPYAPPGDWIAGGSFEEGDAAGWSTGAVTAQESLFGARSLEVRGEDFHWMTQTVSPRIPVDRFSGFGLWVKGEWVWGFIRFLDANGNDVGGGDFHAQSNRNQWIFMGVRQTTEIPATATHFEVRLDSENFMMGGGGFLVDGVGSYPGALEMR